LPSRLHAEAPKVGSVTNHIHIGASSIVLMGWLCLAGPSAAVAQAITDCDPHDGLEPICGLSGSEDIEALPDARHLIVSETHVRVDASGALRWLPSPLSLLNVAYQKKTVLYPTAASGGGRGDWGATDCPGEIGAQLSPLGIHLSRRRDGHWQLLVVNHGSRNSVELFEVRNLGRQLSVTWRGCVLSPPDAFLNDVAALPGGGFVATRYMDATRSMAEQNAEAARGGNTGYVMRWLPGGTLAPIAGTESPLPNGIQASRDGRSLFVSVIGDHGEVRQYSLADGHRLGAVPVQNPDNLSWTVNGLLLAAGLQSGDDGTGCYAHFEQPCGTAFVVSLIDPKTLQAREVFAHAGPPLGLASVAVQLGGDLYIGSPAGDRVMRVPRARWQQ
jgi:hypothetical protein